MSSGERAAELLKLDLFAVLGVSRTANAEDIKKAYLATVKQFHPDRAPSDELRPAFTKAFARIELAKATLMDPTRRSRYLEEIARPGGGGGGPDRSAEASFEFAKAEAYLKTNDRTRAEQHARRAASLVPANVDYAVLLITVQAVDASPGQLKELAGALDALVAKNPESERALFQRGQVRKRLGRTTEAMADFTRVADLNPTNIEAAREIRIHKTRAQEKLAPDAADKGLGGVFKRLFKR